MGGFDVIDGRYGALLERATAVLGADRRVRSVEVGGSVGEGTADRWSDLDLTVVTEPDHHDDVLATWPVWLAEVTPTVFARTPIAPFIVNAVTNEGLTLDLAIWPGEAPTWPASPPQWTVGMMSSLKFERVQDALEYAVAEQLRSLAGPFLTLVQRDEHLKHLAGVPHLLGLLTTVFLAETGLPMPAKLWNATYTTEQRAAVAALPPVSATRDGLIGFGLGLAELLVTRARPLFDRDGLPWPADLAAVTARRVNDVLDIDISAWLR